MFIAVVVPKSAEDKRVCAAVLLAVAISILLKYVPVFAIGAGSKAFYGKMDNTDIPKRIAKAAGY